MNSVRVYDNLLSAEDLKFIKDYYEFSNSTGETNLIDAMDKFPKKEVLYSLAFDVDNTISKPCIAHSIAIETYSSKNKDFVYWEPHHDGKESRVITLAFIDKEHTNNWVGGELDIYSSLDVFDYPNNKQRIDPMPGRVIVFNSSMIHCIRPYFGKTPRMSVSIGWE